MNKKILKSVKAWAVVDKFGNIGSFNNYCGDKGMEIYPSKKIANLYRFEGHTSVPVKIIFLK